MKAVLLSGGIDSLVVAELVKPDLCIFVDYGHPAQVQEGWKAFAYCGERGVPLQVVHAFGLNLGDMGTESGARVVPHRNAILLTLAANAIGDGTVYIGCSGADAEDYADCRHGFLHGMSLTLGVEVAFPLIAKGKREVVEMARAMGLARRNAWSCYGGGPEECGECPSCIEAGQAWGDA